MKLIMYRIGFVFTVFTLVFGCEQNTSYEPLKLLLNNEELGKYLEEVHVALVESRGNKMLPEKEWFVKIPGGWGTLTTIAAYRQYLPIDLRQELARLYDKFRTENQKDYFISFMGYYMSDIEKSFFIEQFYKENDISTKNQILSQLCKSPDDRTAQFAIDVINETPKDLNLNNLFSLIYLTRNFKYVSIIEKLYENEEDLNYKEAELYALVQLQGNTMQNELLDLLEKSISGKSEIRLSWIVILLGECGDEKAIMPLIKVGENTNDQELKRTIFIELNNIAVVDILPDIDLFTVNNYNFDFGLWEKWLKENPEFDAREAQISCLKNDFKEYNLYGKLVNNRFLDYKRIYLLQNEKAVPYLKNIVDLNLGLKERWSQAYIASTLIKFGYFEGYRFLIDKCMGKKIIQEFPELERLARLFLRQFSGRNFGAKNDWCKWLEENKGKFKTISSVK